VSRESGRFSTGFTAAPLPARLWCAQRRGRFECRPLVRWEKFLSFRGAGLLP
jgi:hypothetical protein